MGFFALYMLINASVGKFKANLDESLQPEAKNFEVSRIFQANVYSVLLQLLIFK